MRRHIPQLRHVIGLTGGIGSGKSHAREHLASLGAVVVDADKLGHQGGLYSVTFLFASPEAPILAAYKAGTPCFEKVVQHFGREVVDSASKRRALVCI